MLLEVFGDESYSCWDARYEILRGNLLDPPIISKEVLFAPIDTLRTTLHEPAPPGQDQLNLAPQTTVTSPSFDSYNLDLAKEAFLKRGFSYVQRKDGIYYWTLPGGKVGDEHVSLWEQERTVWIRASTPDAGLPTEPKLSLIHISEPTRPY